MKNKKHLFETQDLNLSAVLVAKGFSLEKITKGPDSKATFSFPMCKPVEATIQAYWKNELLIAPQVLFNALKTLKNRLYSNY